MPKPHLSDWDWQEADAIEANGYDPRHTPIDTLIAGPVTMGLAYAHSMEFAEYE